MLFSSLCLGIIDWRGPPPSTLRAFKSCQSGPPDALGTAAAGLCSGWPGAHGGAVDSTRPFHTHTHTHTGRPGRFVPVCCACAREHFLHELDTWAHSMEPRRQLSATAPTCCGTSRHAPLMGRGSRWRERISRPYSFTGGCCVQQRLCE